MRLLEALCAATLLLLACSHASALQFTFRPRARSPSDPAPALSEPRPLLVRGLSAAERLGLRASGPKDSALPLVVAHRGFSARFPENTMLSFKQGVLSGADGLEMDLRYTKDGEVILMHDSTLDRTTNCSGRVSSWTLADLRAQCVAAYQSEFGSAFAGAGDDVRVPTLKEALELAIAHDLFVVMDLKVEALAQGVERVLQQIGPSSLDARLVASCWTDTQVEDFVARLGNNVTVKQYLGYIDLPPIPPHFFQEQLALGVQGFSLNLTNLTALFVARAAAHLMPVFAWTPVSPQEMQYALQIGVAGTIVNDPLAMIATRAQALAAVQSAFEAGGSGGGCDRSALVAAVVCLVLAWVGTAFLLAREWSPALKERTTVSHLSRCLSLRCWRVCWAEPELTPSSSSVHYPELASISANAHTRPAAHPHAPSGFAAIADASEHADTDADFDLDGAADSTGHGRRKKGSEALLHSESSDSIR